MQASRMLARSSRTALVKAVQAVRAFASKPTFSWEDPLRFKEQLSDEEVMIYDTARQFAESKLQPKVLMGNRNEHFDREIMNDFGSMGFLGPTIKGYGCSGTGYVSYGLIANAVESVDR
jgi:glutaryl-CoA dehydrogenase